MKSKVVVMSALPGNFYRGGRKRPGPDYARFGEATWRWWCEQRGFRFVLLTDLPAEEHRRFPPSVARWFFACRLWERYGTEARIAFVDADTMIRWNTPDLFDAAGTGFAAARDPTIRWVRRSIETLQPFFPAVELPWWEYFNSGVVVMGAAQQSLVNDFSGFVTERWEELAPVVNNSDAGTDQPIWNFLVRRANEAVHWLPPPYNLVHCVRLNAEHMRRERDPPEDWDPFAKEVLSDARAFDFVDLGYVWHFTNVVHSREVTMRETWRRISHHYPGATVAESLHSVKPDGVSTQAAAPSI